MGPFDNPDFESRYRYEQNMTQYFDDHPEWYYINYSIEKVGLHKIYLRFRRPGAEVMYPREENYPMEIRTYSDRPSEVKSVFEPTYYYVGDILITMTARDKFGSVLTDQGVLFNATLSYIEIGENPSPSTITEPDQYLDLPYDLVAKPSNFTDLGTSVYKITMYPIRRGYYNLTVHLCMEFENICTDDLSDGQYLPLVTSPKVIYLTTQFPEPKHAVARGSGLKYSIVNSIEIFYVQLKDLHMNNFDVLNDNIHKAVSKEQWVNAYIEIKDADTDITSQVDFDLNLKKWDLFNGLFQFDYIVKETFSGQMYIHVETLDSEASFIASGSDMNYVYQPEDYTPHPLSPFKVVTASADATVYESYKDLLKAGLAFSDYTRMVQLENVRYTAGHDIRLKIDTRDIFDTKFVQNILDPLDPAPSSILLIDISNHEDTCVSGSDLSRLKKYCRFMSHSRNMCQKFTMCRWLP